MIQHDIVIIGGGPAGLAAAAAAKKSGAEDILILERDSVLGGILNQCIHNGFGLHTFKEATVYLFCLSFLLIRVPENKRQFSFFSECLFEILNKSLDIHKLINFSSVARLSTKLE